MVSNNPLLYSNIADCVLRYSAMIANESQPFRDFWEKTSVAQSIEQNRCFNGTGIHMRGSL